MKNRICEMLGIEYPIFQGGMAWVADGVLAGNVSEAGGLGLIAAANAPVEWVKEQIRIARGITKKPFGVNIMLMSPTANDIAQLVIDEEVPVITTGAGNPGQYIAAWKEAGIKVIPVVPSVALAKRMERYGAEAVVAEGGESGGHIGEINTMSLIPQVADAVEIPVIAAGGIGDGRGIAACFMLGAQGVQVGTRFLVAKECHIHQNYKNQVLKAKDTDTVVTGRCTGHPVRGIKTKFSKTLQKYDKNNQPEEIEKLGTGALRKAVQDGNLDEGTFMAGQIAGLITREQTCKEIVTEMFDEARQLIGKAGDIAIG